MFGLFRWRLVLITALVLFLAPALSSAAYQQYMEALEIVVIEEGKEAPDFTLPAVNVNVSFMGSSYPVPEMKGELNGAEEEDSGEVKTTIDESGGTRVTGSWEKILKWADQRWGSEENVSEKAKLPEISLVDYRGKAVFINFWATWCPPCREEMPTMQKLYNIFREANFMLLAVSIDRTGSRAVTPYMEEMGLTFPGLLNPDSSVSRKYGVVSLPTTFLIDCEGYIVGKAIGARDWASGTAVNLIKALLEGPNCEG